MTDKPDKIPVDTIVKIPRQPGEYKVKGYNKDGSYLLYGGTHGHASFRDAHHVVPAKTKRSKQ